MSQYRIDVNEYWTPWEHKVCKQCFEDNPNAIWLVKVHCFKPHQHRSGNCIRVVIDHEYMDMEPVRTISTSLWRTNWFKHCYNCPDCFRGDRCWFPHSQHELDLWNIKNRLIKGMCNNRFNYHIIIKKSHIIAKGNRRLISQLCDASLSSQSPSEVCRRCFETNPNAVWLAWLRCTDTEQHMNEGTVVVVANNKDKELIKVRPLPHMLTQLDDVARASHRDCSSQSCRLAHSEEELLYWKWEVARKSIFMNVRHKMVFTVTMINHALFPQYGDYSQLCAEYEYPSEKSAIITNAIAEQLTKDNYYSKYHKLTYLEEMESSRRIIAE